MRIPKLSSANPCCEVSIAQSTTNSINQSDTSRTRLVKKTFKGNDFSEVIEYSYDKQLRINKITHSQDGKLHSTTANFVFNDKNLLISYIQTYNLDISPEKTTIEYDENNRLKRIEINRTKNTRKQNFVSSSDYVWANDTLIVMDTRYFLGKVTQKIIYIFDDRKNIARVEGLGEPSIAYTNLFAGYDSSINPLLLRGGYAENEPLSKNNFNWDKTGELHEHKTTITYQKDLVHQYKPGGPKIPTQYKNGLPLKAVTKWYDYAAKRELITGTTTYTYQKF